MTRNHHAAEPCRSWLARNRIALVSGVTAFLIAASSGAGWAYFTANATATGSVATQAVSVTQTNFNNMGATYLPSNLTSTGSFTVTNTGTIAGTATVTIAAPEAWASGLPIRVWPSAPAACTAAANVPVSALSGTWAAPPAINATLNAGANTSFCVRTIISDWKTITSTNGTQLANPAINVSLNASGWVATASTATHVQQTAGMYNLTPNFFDPALSRWFTIRANANNNNCLDVSGSGGSGAGVLSYSCHLNSNQRWEFLPVAGGVQNLVTIRPRHATGTRLTYNGTNARIMNTASGPAQQWYVQQTDTGRFQLVSVATGLCLSMSSSSGPIAQMVACNSASAQLVFDREPLVYDGSFGSWLTGHTIQFSFDGSNLPASTLERCTNAPSCTTWTTQTAIAAGDTTVSFPASTFTNNTYRIVSGGTVLWDGIRLSCSGSWFSGYTCTTLAGFG